MKFFFTCNTINYQRKQIEEEAGVFADEVVGLGAKVNKELETAGGSLTAVDDIGHVRSQDEWGPVPGHKKVTSKHLTKSIILN